MRHKIYFYCHYGLLIEIKHTERQSLTLTHHITESLFLLCFRSFRFSVIFNPLAQIGQSVISIHLVWIRWCCGCAERKGLNVLIQIKHNGIHGVFSFIYFVLTPERWVSDENIHSKLIFLKIEYRKKIIPKCSELQILCDAHTFFFPWLNVKITLE